MLMLHMQGKIPFMFHYRANPDVHFFLLGKELHGLANLKQKTKLLL